MIKERKPATAIPNSSSVPPRSSGSVSPWEKLKSSYADKTPPLTKALDAYLVCCFLMGIMQLAYCIVTNGAHYQQFLGGFLSCVGSFIMTANVRLQMDSKDGKIAGKAIAEFLLGNILLHLFVANVINGSPR